MILADRSVVNGCDGAAEILHAANAAVSESDRGCPPWRRSERLGRHSRLSVVRMLKLPQYSALALALHQKESRGTGTTMATPKLLAQSHSPDFTIDYILVNWHPAALLLRCKRLIATLLAAKVLAGRSAALSLRLPP